MDNTTLLQLSLTALTGMVGVISSGFWVKRWIDKTDEQLDAIQNDIVKIRCENSAIKEALKAKNDCYAQLRHEVSELSVTTNRALIRFCNTGKRHHHHTDREQ